MQFVDVCIGDRIATVSFSRGDGLNALSLQLMEELRDTARRLADNTDITAVVLTGNGVFTAGADLNDPRQVEIANMSRVEQRHHLKLGPDMCDAWQAIEAYTVAAIEGFCIGGGSALASALDYRIMAEDAHMRLPEIALGMNMSWHTLPRLVAQIGPALTKRYVILCEKIPAAQAQTWGLCEEVVPNGKTLEHALAYAAKVAAMPPLAVRMSKQAVNQATYALANATTFMDRDQFMLATHSDDYKEAIAAYLQKRDPEFTGN